MLEQVGVTRHFRRFVLACLLGGGVDPLVAGLKVGAHMLRRGLRQGRSDSMIHFVLTLAVSLEALTVSFRDRGFWGRHPGR